MLDAWNHYLHMWTYLEVSPQKVSISSELNHSLNGKGSNYTWRNYGLDIPRGNKAGPHSIKRPPRNADQLQPVATSNDVYLSPANLVRRGILRKVRESSWKKFCCVKIASFLTNIWIPLLEMASILPAALGGGESDRVVSVIIGYRGEYVVRVYRTHGA